MQTVLEHSDVEVWSRVVEPENPGMTPEAARGILALDFPPRDKERATELGIKSNAGTLTPNERSELESYVRVGKMLAILQAKARRFLRPDAA